MKKAFQKLLSSLTVLAMVLTLLPAVRVTAATGSAWAGEAFTESGSYYLQADTTLSGEITVKADQEIVLDLNGYVLTVGEGYRGFTVKGKLTVRDSVGTGKLTGSGGELEGRGGIFYISGSNAVLTLESGAVTGGRVTDRGGNIYNEGGTFHMTGGTVSGGYAGGRGGNIASTGTLNISGGTVSGGKAEGYGGNILSTGEGRPVNISGDAVITGGVAASGGNISLIYSMLNMSGGTVSLGSAEEYGGNIHTYGGADKSWRSTVNISGGKVGDVAADSAAGSIFLNGNAENGTGCVVNISGGTLEGRTGANFTASITLSGAPVIQNLCLATGMLVTPKALEEGAQIAVSSVKGCADISGLLTDAEAFLPYFSAYEADCRVGVANNVLTLTPGCPCGCDAEAEAVEWTDLSSYTGGTLPGGHYYVPAEGLTLTEQLTVEADTAVILDLRGSTLTAAEGSRAFCVYGKLSILDSGEDGKLVGGAVSGGHGGTIMAYDGAELNLYDGTVTGGSAQRGGNIYITYATFNMYGGAVTDGVADQSLTTGTSTTNGRGGNIFLNNCTADLTGGVISGGQSLNATSTFGGNVMIMGNTTEEKRNPVTISGDIQITGGTAKRGSSIAIAYNTVTMTGGRIEDGIVYAYGSGTSFCTLELSGGYVEHLYAYQTNAVNLSGDVKIDCLQLGSGMLITACDLAEGAQICLDAAEGAVSGELDDAQTEAAYFTACDEGYTVGAADGALYYGVACDCGCGALASEIDWIWWEGEAITKSGHYRLGAGLWLDGTVTVPEGLEVVIDLYGEALYAADDLPAFSVSGSLTVMDSAGGGVLYGATAYTGNGAAVEVEGGSLSLRSGEICGGTTTGSYGGNIYMASGSLYLYGGTVSGGSAGDRGGNVYMASGSLYLYGGTVSGGSAGDRGGNVYMASGNIYLYDGVIEDGSAAERGGNLFVTSGNVYMTGGSLLGGTITTTNSNESYGGNVMITGRNSNLHVSGDAKLTAGTASKGSTICLMYGNLYVSGGTITGGKILATETGLNYSGLYFSGGEIGASVTVSGDMEDGKAALVAITGGTFTESFTVNSANHVILSGAPELSALSLAEGVKITPVELQTVVPLTATGVFTTTLEDPEAYIEYFAPTEGTVLQEDGVLLVSTVTASGTSGNITWTLTTDGTLTLTGTGAMNNYYYYSSNLCTIPWVDYLTDIKKAVVGEGVTTLGNYTFYGCTALKEVELASTVTTLGNYAFYGCTALTGLELPNGVLSVGKYCFADAGLTELSLPDSLTTLGTYAFSGCAALTAVTMGTGTATVGKNAFDGCDALTVVYYRGTASQWDGITVNTGNDCLTAASVIYSYSGGTVAGSISWTLTGGDTLTVTGSGEMPGYYRNSAYSDLVGTPWSAYADRITRVVITGFTSVGEWAFYDLDKLTEVSLSASVTVIEENAFRDCDALTGVSLPDTVVRVEESAFLGCDKLASATLGSCVEVIGSYAFYDCAALTGITIPAPTVTIGKDAFGCCGAMTAISVADGSSAFMSVNGALLNETGETLIRVPCGFTGSYTVPDTVKTVAENAFADCGSLTDVTLSDNVTAIESGAFFGSSVTTVTLGAGVAAIADTAFNDCGALTAFLCDGNEYYKTDEAGALYTADGATLLQIPGGITGEYTVADTATAVGGSAAAWNRNLSKVILPNNVTSLGTYAFAGTAFETLDMTSGTDTVKKGAFESAALTTVNYLGTEATWGRMSVKDANEPLLAAEWITVTGGYCSDTVRWDVSADGVLTVTGSGALPAFTKGAAPWYVHSGGITAVVIGEGITGISANAFFGMAAVTETTLPESLTNVEENAFCDCAALTAVRYAGTAYQWQQVTVAEGNEPLQNATFSCAEAILTGMQIETLPDKLAYDWNEAPELTGLTLTLLYHDGTSVRVTELTEEYTVAAELTRIGENTVTVTFGEFSVTYTVTVRAAGQCGENAQWLLEDGVLTISGTGAMDDYTEQSPAPWLGLNVDFDTVVLEAGITAIGAYTFAKTEALTVYLPESVLSVGENAFGGEKETEDTVFYGGSRTTFANITVNETNNVALAGAGIHYARVDLTSLEITAQPDKLIYLQNEALETEGMELTAHYDDGSSLTVTEYEAAADMTLIGSVTVTVSYGGKTVEYLISIGYGGYTEDGLVWQYADGVLTVDCVEKEEAPVDGVMLDYTAEEPAPWAVHAEEIKSIVVGEGVTVLGTYAFASCAELTSVILPSSLTDIRENAFLGTEKLEAVTFAGEEEQWKSVTVAQTGNETFLALSPVADVTLGDIDSNGRIDALDLGVLQAYLAGKTAYIDAEVADIDGNGRIDALDLGVLQAHLAGKTVIGE